MMTFNKWVFSGLMASLALASSVASAHPPGHGGGHGGWRGNVGIYFGSPYPFYPYPYAAYPYPYVYSPPPVIVTQSPQPQVYIEQDSSTAQTPAQTTPPAASGSNNGQGYWYYCEQSDGYYPYVKECPAGWKQVTPSPPPSTSAR